MNKDKEHDRKLAEYTSKEKRDLQEKFGYENLTSIQTDNYNQTIYDAKKGKKIDLARNSNTGSTKDHHIISNLTRDQSI